jgi:galactose mutarotase-like enzyme
MDMPKVSDFENVTMPMGNQISINPLGGLFTLTLNHLPILIPVNRGDGKSIMTHVCTPNFGKELNTFWGLKQHGDLRNSNLNLIKSGNNIQFTHNITDAPGKYPDGVKANVNFSLNDTSFILTVTHKNTGKTPAPVNCGIHCYFNAPKSYIGTKVNGSNITKSVETTGSVNLKTENIIEIPDMPKLYLDQIGLNKAVTWIYRSPEGKFDTNYVCIEPVEQLPTEFGKPVTLLQPGAERRVELILHQ